MILKNRGLILRVEQTLGTHGATEGAAHIALCAAIDFPARLLQAASGLDEENAGLHKENISLSNRLSLTLNKATLVTSPEVFPVWCVVFNHDQCWKGWDINNLTIAWALRQLVVRACSGRCLVSYLNYPKAGELRAL